LRRPSGLATDPFSLPSRGHEEAKKAALAKLVLFQRERHVLIEPLDKGILVTILHSAKEIVPASKAFAEIESPKTDPEMVDIISLIKDKKATHFDLSKFTNNYEEAIRQLIEAKRTGALMPKPARRPKENVKDLADILRKSLEAEGLAPPKGKPKAKSSA
jgi:DNA end-binding protein Ku